MKPLRSCFIFPFVVYAAGFFFYAPYPVLSGILYKSYIVKNDRGVDILCDAHIIQKNDSVGGLLLQKGEIAQSNFSEFLSILKRLNPHIPDISNVRPGEHLFIPIKKLQTDTIPGQSSGVITLPFITISKIQQLIRTQSEKHRVQKGDCVSILIARRFGPLGSSSYSEGLAMFERANSSIKNLNRIYPGQTIYLPNSSIRNEPWFASAFPISEGLPLIQEKEVMESYVSSAEPSASWIQKFKDEKKPSTPFPRIAFLLNAKLTTSGSYFFPVKEGSDVHLDLSRSPLLELADGRKFLFTKEELKIHDLQAIRSFWKQIETVPVDPEPSAEHVMDSLAQTVPEIFPNQSITFSDQQIGITIKARWIFRDSLKGKNQNTQTVVFLTNSIEERISEPVTKYLEGKGIHVMELDDNQTKDKPSNTGLSESRNKEFPAGDIFRVPKTHFKDTIKEIISLLGFRYSPDITISFPYAGVQVKALSNLITSQDERAMMIDFGDLQGDAVRAIREAGFNIIQISLTDDLENTLKKLLVSLGIKFEINPILPASDISDGQKISLTIPGLSITKEPDKKILLTHDDLDEAALLCLKEHFSKIITIRFKGWLTLN
ncbi:MAG: LysM domain-containing protein [Thermodesulfobacteriota bacterium]